MKKCSQCLIEKTVDDFYMHEGKSKPRCKVCISANRREAYRLNPSARLDSNNNWRKKNSEYVAEKKQQWASMHRSRRRVSVKKWAQSNPRAVLDITLAYQRRLKMAAGGYTQDDWEMFLAFGGSRCMVPECENLDVARDHIIPLSKGGSNTLSNLQLLCKHHNGVKGVQSTDYRPQAVIENYA